MMGDGQRHLVGGEGVRAMSGAPAREPPDQALAGGLVTAAALPQSTSCPEARSQAFQIQSGSDFFEVVPYFIELDHHRPAFWRRLVCVGDRELL